MSSGEIASNALIVERLIEEVFNRQDLTAFPKLVAAEVVDHQAVIFAQPDGAGGVAAGIGALARAFPDPSIAIGEPRSTGDRVVARLTLAWTNTGDYRGLPATTKRHARWEAI